MSARSEAAEWRAIAEAFAGHTNARTCAGLCYAIECIPTVGFSFAVWSTMTQRIRAHLQGAGWAYAPDVYGAGTHWNYENRLARALAADWLALEAEEEAEGGQ